MFKDHKVGIMLQYTFSQIYVYTLQTVVSTIRAANMIELLCHVFLVTWQYTGLSSWVTAFQQCIDIIQAFLQAVDELMHICIWRVVGHIEANPLIFHSIACNHSNKLNDISKIFGGVRSGSVVEVSKVQFKGFKLQRFYFLSNF